MESLQGLIKAFTSSCHRLVGRIRDLWGLGNSMSNVLEAVVLK